MIARPAMLLSSLLMIFGSWSEVVFANADVITFNNCMATERDKFKQFCRNAVSADPGDPQASIDCMNNGQAAIEVEATKKCRKESGLDMERQSRQPITEQEPEGTGSGAGGCVSVAGKYCPPKTGPTPPRRPPQISQAPMPVPRPPSLNQPARTAPAAPAATPAANSNTPARTEPAQTQRDRTPRNDAPPSASDRNNRQAVTSSQNTTPQPEASAGNDANSDIQLCENSYSAASRCCGSPTACVNELPYQDQANYAQLNSMMNQPQPTSQQGLTEYCQQMQGLGGQSAGVNTSLAGICNNKQQSCSLVCNQLANKYLTLLSNCNGCESNYVYQNAYNTLSSRNMACGQFQARVQQIASQAFGANTSQGMAEMCNRVAGANPSSIPSSAAPIANAGVASLAGTNGGNDPYGCSANPSSASCQSCSANPNTPACRALNFSKEATGTAQFGGPEGTTQKKNGSGFDIPDTPAGGTERVLNTGFEPQAIKNKTIANNSGGGIPGGDGGTSAKLGGAPPKGGQSPGAPGYTTDILQGTQGSGGYSAPVESNSGGGIGKFFSGLFGSKAAADQPGAMVGVDLRQFLPGGSRDPHRRLAGIGFRGEINAKEEDIWRRISTKMEEKCKLGLLIGCR